MIALVTGTLGSGKTFYAVKKIEDALGSGRCVATNIDLVPDYAERIARHLYRRRLTRSVAYIERDIRSRFFYSEDLDELSRVRLTGTKEGRGYMALDEGHGWLNSRAWNDSDRMTYVRFFTQARKLGWYLDLITQDEKNIDRQVRDLYEYKTRVRNLQKLKVAGLPLVPFKLFMAITSWNGANNAIIKRDFYRISWVAKLYDTHAIHHGLAELMADPSVVLPRPSDAPLGASSGESADTRPLYERQAEEALLASAPSPSEQTPLVVPDGSVSSNNGSTHG